MQRQLHIDEAHTALDIFHFAAFFPFFRKLYTGNLGSQDISNFHPTLPPIRAFFRILIMRPLLSLKLDKS